MRYTAMVIAPGSPIDRTWAVKADRAVRFMEAPPFMPWSTVQSEQYLCESTPVQMATLQRMRAPGWKIILSFFVDDRLAIGSPDGTPVIPRGYVMPGWVEGEQLERHEI